MNLPLVWRVRLRRLRMWWTGDYSNNHRSKRWARDWERSALEDR